MCQQVALPHLRHCNRLSAHTNQQPWTIPQPLRKNSADWHGIFSQDLVGAAVIVDLEPEYFAAIPACVAQPSAWFRPTRISRTRTAIPPRSAWHTPCSKYQRLSIERAS